MDKLTDYIPLVIIVISFVVSIVKGSRKKSKENHSKTTLPKGSAGKTIPQSSQTGTGGVASREVKPGRDSGQSKYESWDDRVIRELESIQVQRKAPEVFADRLGKNQRVYDRISDIIIEEDADMITSGSDDRTELIDSIKNGFQNPDDLKRAVIFSEILQRKYS